MYATTRAGIAVQRERNAAAEWGKALLLSAFWVAVVFFLLPGLAHATGTGTGTGGGGAGAAQTRINAVAAGWQNIVQGGVEPEVLVNVFAGRLTDVEMPEGLGSTPEIDKMVDTCANLMTSIVKDEYANRVRFEGGTGHRDSFIALESEGIVAPAKTELAARMAFMESSIDAAAGMGAIGQVNADMLKERIEAQVFQPRPPQSLQFSKEFTAFFEQRGKGIRINAMKEVRGVTQSQTVKEIIAKLKALMLTTSRWGQPTDHRAQKPMER
jgi:hypothetical protein